MSRRLGDEQVRYTSGKQRCGAAALAILLALPGPWPGAVPAFAEESDSGGGPSISLDPNVGQPPAFSSNSGSVMESLFACPNLVQATARGLGDGLAGLVNSASTGSPASAPNVTIGASDQPCPAATGGVRVPANLSCSSPALLTSSNFDPAKLRRFVEALSAELRPLQCRVSRLDGIAAEAQCLSEGMRTLQNEINQLGQLYQTNIGRMQQEASQLQSVEQGAMAQIAEAQSRMNGIEGSSTRGIAQLRDQLTEAVNNINQEVAAMSTQVRQLRLQREAYRDQVERARMGMAAECFNDTRQSSYRCERNGPIVSAREHLECIYEQRTRLSGRPGGPQRVETGVEARAESQGRTNALRSVMDRIFADIGPANPPSDQEAAAAAGAPRARGRLRSPEELLARYGGELEGLDGNGVDVSGFVMQLFTSCYRRSVSALESGRSSSDSGWAVRDATLSAQEETLRNTINQALERYSNLYAESSRALTLQDRPLDIAACNRGSPETAVSCMTEVQNVLNGVVRGTNQFGQVALTIDANGPVPAVRFVCNGLSGCAADLDRLMRNRMRDVTRVQTARQKYVQDARRNLDQFTNQMRQAAMPRIMIMRNRMELIARAMGVAGVRGASLPMNPIPRAEIQYDENGVPQVPQDLMGLIVGGENGAPRVDSETFSEISSQMADARERAAEQRDEIQGRITELEGLASTCPGERVQTLAERAQRSLGQLTDLNCWRERTFCEESGTFQDAVNTANQLSQRAGGAGLSDDVASSLASLSSGAADACPGRQERYDYQARRASCTEIENEVARISNRSPPASEADIRALELRRAQACNTSLVGELPSQSRCASTARQFRQEVGAVQRALGTGGDAGSTD